MTVTVRRVGDGYEASGYTTGAKIFIGFTILIALLVSLASPMLILITFPLQTLIIYLVRRSMKGVHERAIAEFHKTHTQTQEQKEFEEFKRWKEQQKENWK